MTYEIVDDLMEKNQRGETQSPIAEHLAMKQVAFGRGEATYEMEVRTEISNVLGVIQGGIVTALADAAMAAASVTILDDQEITNSAITTIDIFARFIRPVSLEGTTKLRADARVVRAGGRLVWSEAEVTKDDDPEPVAKFASTGIRVSFDPSQAVTK